MPLDILPCGLTWGRVILIAALSLMQKSTCIRLYTCCATHLALGPAKLLMHPSMRLCLSLCCLQISSQLQFVCLYFSGSHTVASGSLAEEVSRIAWRLAITLLRPVLWARHNRLCACKVDCSVSDRPAPQRQGRPNLRQASALCKPS